MTNYCHICGTALVERKIEMVFVMLTNIIEETTYLICAGEKADELGRKSITDVHKEGVLPCA